MLHELGGLNPETIAFADRLVERGFSVHLPLLFGRAGQTMTPLRMAGDLVRFCISREWRALAVGESRPIAQWVRALGREVFRRCGGKGIGAIGMCLTGSFVIPLVLEPEFLVTPVTCEPSVPLGITRSRRCDPGISPTELAGVRERLQQTDVVLLGYRFSNDGMSPPERFETYRERLGDRFEGCEIDSSPGNPHGIPGRSHSVFTFDYRDEPDQPTRQALEQVVAYFKDRLEN
jgi:dienelactone hydrolase